MVTLKNIKLTPNQKKGLIAAAVFVPLCAWVALRTSCVGATPSAGDEAPVLPTETTQPVVSDAGVAALPKVIPTTATLSFSVVPSNAIAFVSWGKKKLGKIEKGKPLVIVRPRDSGPLDVTVRAEGFLPVHTRAYTFDDGKVMVKLTKLAEVNTLLGYRQPIDAGVSEDLDQEPPPPPGPGPAMPPTLFGN